MEEEKMDRTTENLSLHYKINCEFNNNGKNLSQIIKEHFFIYLKELQKQKKLWDLIY